MEYYITFTGVNRSDTRFFEAAVFSVSNSETAPNAKILKAYKEKGERYAFAGMCIVQSRVITPDDFQEFIKMGVQSFKI